MLVEDHRQHEGAISPALLEKTDPVRNDRPRDVSMVFIFSDKFERAAWCFSNRSLSGKSGKFKGHTPLVLVFSPSESAPSPPLLPVWIKTTSFSQDFRQLLLDKYSTVLRPIGF